MDRLLAAMKRTPVIVLVAASVGGAIAAPAGAITPRPLSIFLVVGQSNAAGFGQPVPTGQHTNPRVWDLSDGIKRATNPLGDAPGVGFPVTTGIVLARHGLRVGLVQCASGGLSIDAWQPGASWYDGCLARVRNATRYGVIRGILFHQGETDSGTAAMARAWPGKFRAFVASIRRDLSDPSLPIVFGLTRDFSGCHGCGLPYGPLLRGEQRRIRISRVALVAADDLPVSGEHFTPAGYAVLGERYAAAWLMLNRS